MRNVERDTPRGLNVRALLESCPEDMPGLRDRALLSTGYDTGLRASELVAIEVAHIVEAIDPDARLLTIPRNKGDQEGEGATAYLSPRSVRAIAAWREAAGIASGPVFRRVNVRRYKARAAVRGRKIDSISGREAWDLRKTLPKPAVKARVEYDVGEGALHPASVGPIYRSMIQRAFDGGALEDLTADDLARLLKGVSAHSTRVGLNQDLFASGEDLAGIMDALRWKSPRMPLAYNRNLAAEQGGSWPRSDSKGRILVGEKWDLSAVPFSSCLLNFSVWQLPALMRGKLPVGSHDGCRGAHMVIAGLVAEF